MNAIDYRPSPAALLGLLLTASSLPLHAQWASIRANNRDHDEHFGRGRQEIVRAPERARVEEHRDFRREEEPRDRMLHERGHWDGDIDRHQGDYWSGYHSGMILRSLPPGYVNLVLGGRPYYYYEGVYYEPGPSGYVVVNPPIGVTVSALPPGAQAVAVNGAIYYYAAGAYYVQQPTGYVVVPPPPGVTVSLLPSGAVPVTINGMLYYMADNVYYLPVMQGGVTVYTVVRP